jgi:DNA-binding PadR family transcriptional regulator
MRDTHSRRRRHHPEGPGPEFGGPREHEEHDHEHGGRHEHGPRGFRGGPGGREGFREGRRGGPGGRGRAQRGDVRAATLILLSEAPMHGYQLMQAMAERTNGVWRPSPGAIYPTIAQLEDEGLVTTLAEGGRKLVTLTDAGRAYLTDNAATLADPFAALLGTPGQSLDLRSALEEVHAAARAVGRTGTEAQVAAAFAVLGEARRSLYLILAEGPVAATPVEPPAEPAS